MGPSFISQFFRSRHSQSVFDSVIDGFAVFGRQDGGFFDNRLGVFSPVLSWGPSLSGRRHVLAGCPHHREESFASSWWLPTGQSHLSTKALAVLRVGDLLSRFALPPHTFQFCGRKLLCCLYHALVLV